MSVIISSFGYKIKIKSEVIKILKSYRQLSMNDCEAGGILIGYETLSGDIIIEYATKPLRKDGRTRISFNRVDKRHNKILKSIWTKQGNIHVYMGEWHTHPEPYPNYSSQDRMNWIQIGDKMNKSKFIHIIVGNKEVGVWEYKANDKRILKIGELLDG
ncbi:MAG: Mov34/MPN/PAD-1 family protein [Clostridium sp.]|uniref:Mov34/MPN/PAD-1 family protein n=1 Tax=Clostridium TaxID=1485 RepID=UPI00189EE0E6|nr:MULTISPECIES: Mov34/MPN/PAD-1 family protein [Clostridium]MDB2121513.1 Mov34/MPN/PAD-1 family protein [Clostridium paraputrificum]MDU2755499.1 Mov34/MPN/PAD-1 family protein [Clostridium sp.]MDU2901066.1 Mov34/MPN/PAD-1 family protein [Clostridium sp.]MDU4426761.1 Mov34/MPN/PAD-1 family protein [Clostridium sp.]MDU7461380.1 Mov34/MPN/PAD-1 family protein [Clostridium sp.]